MTWLTRFERPLSLLDLPREFPSPFDELGPHPLARLAAEHLQAELRIGSISGTPVTLLDGGKMFGVLVVREPSGEIGYLRAFSGMLNGRWELPGFVPPVFDAPARAAIEPDGDVLVKGLLNHHDALASSRGLAELRTALQELELRHAAAHADLRTQHESNRRQRHQRRADMSRAGLLSEDELIRALKALDQESRGDKADRRRAETAQERELLAIKPSVVRLERRLAALDRLRRMASRRLMKELQDTYTLQSARGERRPLRPLYAPREPPSGAADCAAPKLIAFALSNGLQPVALAEFWWGAPPLAGGRVAGAYYSACRDKCGPVLPFMLDGLSVSPPRRFSPPSLAPDGLKIIFEDEWIVVIEKPCGLLSVPAREASVTDSVLARLRARYPSATGPLLAHRLDMDTSGLLVAALDQAGYANLQCQFSDQQVKKRYIAWVDGRVTADAGTIDFPMRVDIDDRPRQIHDPVYGKAARTDWQVLAREGDRTRMALFPRSGRTHQLRVHAAHPLGLGAAIVGDRLYGREGERLLLHAQRLELRHPATGKMALFESPAPF